MTVPEQQPASDADLARQVMASERAATAEDALCRRFAPRVRAYGLRHLRDRTAADDLVQRTLELTLTKLRAGAVREPDRIASFVLGIARMQAHEMRRRDRREEPIAPEDAAQVAAAAAAAPRPLATDRLAGCLEALGERERSIILLSFYDERSASEIAATLAIGAGNVRVIRHRAVRRLRQCMELGEEGP